MKLAALFLILVPLVVNGKLAPIAARLPLPGTPSPPGTPWPLVAEHVNSSDRVTIASQENFRFSSPVTDCVLLDNAFERYSWEFLFHDVPVQPDPSYSVLSEVVVQIPTGLENLCSEYPKLDKSSTYESYNISISITGEATIQAHTIWGALRGLETFSQLIWQDSSAFGGNNYFYVNVTEIQDYPRYPHRGLMIDTARHYVDLPVIQDILDGMAHLKLNVFHWHMVDDQSFPFVSRKYPTLSQEGAYLPLLTYEPEEVRAIVDYARERGIRVIIEFDTPGHTLGFGKAFPELLTPCYGDGVNPGTPNYPYHAAYEILDPTKNFTYDFMREFFEEIVGNVNVDDYIHLGMDEVYYACWESSPEIAQFMDDHGYTEYSQVQQHYTERHLDMINDLGGKSIIWQDPLDFGVSPAKDVMIQVWKGYPNNWQNYFWNAISLGYDVLLSSCWYINYINYGESWRAYYECDPLLSLNQTLTPEQEDQIYGGEAAIWGEYVDSTNIFPRIFPYLGAIAERLWSPPESSSTDDAMHRLDEFRCLLLWRGFSAQPIFNGYCSEAEKSGLRTK